MCFLHFKQFGCFYLESSLALNPLSPTSDQDRISSYTISTISSRQVMRIKKNLIGGLLVDLIPNSPKHCHINCKADSKENY